MNVTNFLVAFFSLLVIGAVIATIALLVIY
jgi:hypothetical protein